MGNKNPKQAEDSLYRLFINDDPAEAFDEACEFWGEWFPEISYLLFMKDSNMFVPVKTTHHQDSFSKLNIDTDCLEHGFHHLLMILWGC